MGWWDRDPEVGAITDKDFTYDGVTYSVKHIRVGSDGSLQLNVDQDFTATALANLVLDVDGSQFPLSDSTGTNDSLRSWQFAGLIWTVGTDVVLKMLAQTSSTDATLSGLVLNDGTNDLTLTPAFATGTTSYAASVGNAVSQITVTPETNDSNASVEYLDGNDAAITDADGTATGQQVALVVGANTIKVKVTAEDDATTGTYTVVVTRPLADVTLVSNENATVGTGNSSVIQAQSFVTGTNAGGYTLSEIQIRLGDSTVLPSVTSVIATVKADDSGAPGTLVANLVNPASLTADAFNAFTAPAGTTLAANTTYWVVINEERSSGSDRVRLFSTEDDDEDIALPGWSIGNGRRWKSNASDASWGNSSSSNLIIVKGTVTGGTSSTDATLSGLVLNDGTNDLTLTPAFATGTTSYAASVGNAVSQITVTPETNDSNASVEYLDGSDAAITDADGTATGQQVALVVGANTIKVKVTAEDATTTETYTVVVTRTTTTSPTKPGQTTGVNVNARGDGTLLIGWTPPSNDGGSAITGYKVQWKSGSQSFGGDPSREHTAAAEATTYLITGLTNGTEYTVRVIAVNAVEHYFGHPRQQAGRAAQRAGGVGPPTADGELGRTQ